MDSVQLYLGKENRQITAGVFSSDDIFNGRESSGANAPREKWSHISITYDGGSSPTAVKIFRNGVKIDIKDSVAGRFTIFNDLNVTTEIGSQNGGTGDHFNGTIDDVRIYDRALSEEQVKALYEFEKPKE